MHVLIIRIFAILSLLLTCTLPVVAQNGCGFSNWDQNDDSYIDVLEFNSAIEQENYFEIWDIDLDGQLSEHKWGAGVEVHLNMYDPGKYGYYHDWDDDRDGVLTDNEFKDELFDAIEEDDSSTIEENEWDIFDVKEDGIFC